MSKNMLGAAQDRYWFTRGQFIAACSRYGCTRDDDARLLANEAFMAGANWNMRTTSALSPHIAKFIEMLILLGICDDAQVIRETESGSALWHSTGGNGASNAATGYQPEPPY